MKWYYLMMGAILLGPALFELVAKGLKDPVTICVEACLASNQVLAKATRAECECRPKP